MGEEQCERSRWGPISQLLYIKDVLQQMPNNFNWSQRVANLIWEPSNQSEVDATQVRDRELETRTPKGVFFSPSSLSLSLSLSQFVVGCRRRKDRMIEPVADILALKQESNIIRLRWDVLKFVTCLQSSLWALPHRPTHKV